MFLVQTAPREAAYALGRAYLVDCVGKLMVHMCSKPNWTGNAMHNAPDLHVYFILDADELGIPLKLITNLPLRSGIADTIPGIVS